MDAASRWVVLRGKLVAAQISASDIERREVENASRMDTTLSSDFRPSSDWRPASRFISRIQSRNTGHGNGVATAKQSRARATQCAGRISVSRCGETPCRFAQSQREVQAVLKAASGLSAHRFDDGG